MGTEPNEVHLRADHALLRALSRRDVLSEEEKRVLEALPLRLREFGPGEELIREGSAPSESCLILGGLAARSQILANGKRQLTALHIAGDFVDLHSFLLKIMDHSVIALSACRAAFVAHSRLRLITEEQPHLARMLWLMTTIDAAIHRSWATCLGRRSAKQHLAHLLCELQVRLDAVGLADESGFGFPVTQGELGDMLGLSIVHVNRTVRALRATGLVSWRGQHIRILDFDRLAAFAEFDPLYLNLVSRPR